MVAYLKHWNGTPTVFFEGHPVFPGINCTGMPQLDGWTEAELARRYAAAGVHLHAFDMGANGMDHEWRGPGPGRPEHWDLSGMKAKYGRVVDVDPEARFFLRFHLEIYDDWWLNMYPEEREVDSEGVLQRQSFASVVWREQATEFVRQYAAQFRELGLLDRVYAWQTGAGDTGEWVKSITSMQHQCGDYSAPMQRHFRAWLGNKYADVEALRQAWANDAASFETATAPSAQEQLQTRHGVFRDPRYERKVIDYFDCLAELCGDLVIGYNRTVKEATQGTVLAGAFFGYLLELAWNCAFFGGGDEGEHSAIQRSGHLGLRRILESPYVDFIASPFAYGFRGIGGYSPAMMPTESLRLHGKLYYMEDDLRTYLCPQDAGFGVVDTFDRSIATLRRNMNEVLTRGMGVWWVSNPTAVDMVLEPAFQPEIQHLQRLGEFALSLDRKPCAEIAVLVDDESYQYEQVTNELDLPLIFQQRLWGLPRIGAPCDHYIMQDLLDGKLPPYKVYIFLNAFHLDAKRRAQLAHELHRDGKVAVWIYAPGYLKDEPGLEHMTELTGIRFDKGEHAWGPLMHILDYEHPITAGLSQDLMWGTNDRLQPVFHVEDPEAHTLGQVVYSQGRCKPGYVVKEFADWKSIYIAAPNIPAPVLRGIARWAGVHLYNEEGDVLYATRELLGVHTVSGGERAFALPRAVEVVYDLYNKRLVAENAERFSVTIPAESTQLWFCGEKRLLTTLLARNP